MRILGIDPGSITCGYGIIETPKNKKTTDCIYITSGRIVTPRKKKAHIVLKDLYDTLVDIIREYSPHEVVVEKVFFAKSAKAVLSLGQARGIALLAAASCGLNVVEYSALEVKKAITGYGRAEKRQVQEMVMRILFPRSSHRAQAPLLTEDSADALALAFCHLNTLKFKEAIDRR
ncbi:MAG: crossover junction endodeoxyribonuclease RuvC [Nitrospira sp.]|nr:crossover junction endodeoxyribonuclease RuvC [Nitrospira sp.]